MFICAGGSETFPNTYPIGVGLVESAINLTKLCLSYKPESLTFIGSAGSYGKHKLLDTVHSAKASNIEHSFLNDTAYTPLDNVIDSNTDYKSNIIVNSSNYITTSKDISRNYLELNIELENMEFFSVLSVAKSFNIPVSGIFVITNYCFENAHEEFLQNHEKVKIIISNLLK